MMEFYFDNKTDNINEIKKYKNKENTILSYNVHSFININGEFSVEKNIDNIYNIVLDLLPEIIVFQEFPIQNSNIFILMMEKIGYQYYSKASNGTTYDTMFVIVFSKLTIDNINILDCKVDVIQRKVIICTINNINYCFVQFDNNNHILRIKQIDKILNYKKDLDFIIGDCNFTDRCPEADYLRKNNYEISESNINTTPHNRIDFFIYNKNSKYKIEKEDVIICNYSEHLPIICNIK